MRRFIALSLSWLVLILGRSEEHTSELQSRPHLVCRLLLEKKKGTAHRRDAAHPRDGGCLNLVCKPSIVPLVWRYVISFHGDDGFQRQSCVRIVLKGLALAS